MTLSLFRIANFAVKGTLVAALSYGAILSAQAQVRPANQIHQNEFASTPNFPKPKELAGYTDAEVALHCEAVLGTLARNLGRVAAKAQYYGKHDDYSEKGAPIFATRSGIVRYAQGGVAYTPNGEALLKMTEKSMSYYTRDHRFCDSLADGLYGSADAVTQQNMLRFAQENYTKNIAPTIK